MSEQVSDNTPQKTPKQHSLMPLIADIIAKRTLTKQEVPSVSAAGYLASPKNALQLQQKLDLFQKSLQVGSKQILPKGFQSPSKLNLVDEIQNGHRQARKVPINRRVVKRLDGLVDYSEQQAQPSQDSIFKKNISSGLGKSADLSLANLNNQGSIGNLSRIDSLPNIRKSDDHLQGQKSPFGESASSFQIFKKKNGQNSTRSLNSSLIRKQEQDELKLKALEIFKKGEEKAKQQQLIDEELIKQKQEDSNAIAEKNNVNELKKLRLARKAKAKLKRLEKMKQKIEEIKQLENLISKGEEIKTEEAEQAAERIKILHEELLQKEDSQASDQLSRASNDSFLQRLDEISLFDESEESENDQVIASQPAQSSKGGSKGSLLESIMEEHSQYFDQLAGKEVKKDAQERVKCAVNMKKPVFIDMQWKSSYSRFFSNNLSSQSSTESNFKDNDIRIQRYSYRTQLPSAQDYNSTFKNDYRLPSDSDFKKITKEPKFQEAPLYSLSNYKSNFVDWKIEPCDRNFKAAGQQNIVFNTPILGESTMKKDYQNPPFLPYTQLSKPGDQMPLPRYSLGLLKKTKNEELLNLKEQVRNLLTEPKEKYQAVPSFEGQYISSQKRDYKQMTKNNQQNKDLFQLYEKKIEKYEQKLQKEIQQLEAVK